MQGDESEAAIVDFHLEIVDAGIAGDDVSQQLVVALDKAPHGSAQVIFRYCTHRQETRLQLVEPLGDMAAILIHRWRSMMTPRRYVPVTNAGIDR